MKGSTTASLLLPLLASVTRTSAHGFVSNLVINGVFYRGWLPTEDPYKADPPIGVGWETPNLGNGFVLPEEASTDAIVCHKEAEPARGYASVAAGDKIYIQWQPNPWPESHHGTSNCPLLQFRIIY